MNVRAPLKLALLMLFAGIALGYIARSRLPLDHSHPAAHASHAGAQEAAPPASVEKTRPLRTILSRHSEREALLWLRTRWGQFGPADYAAAATDVVALGASRHEALLRELLENWGRVAPQDALAFLETLPSGWQNDGIPNVVAGWAKHDPDGLLAWCRNQKNFGLFQQTAVISALAPSRPDATFELVKQLQETDPDLRRFSFASFFGNLAKADPAKALQFFDQLSKSEQKNTISYLIKGWSYSDPDAALAWVDSFPKGPIREHGFLEITRIVGLTSPREAAELASRELTSSENVMTSAYSIAWGWAATNLTEARHFFDELPESPFKRSATVLFDQRWAMLEPLDYLNRSLDKQDFSDEGMRWSGNAARSLAQKDPEALIRWVTENGKEIPAGKLYQLISDLAWKEPELAGQFLSQCTDGSLTDSNYHNVGLDWARQDMEGARRFLETLPPGSARDHFQTGLITVATETDLQAALKEVEEIDNPKMQSDLFNGIFSKATDFSAIGAWAQSRPQNKETVSLYQNIVKQWADRDAEAAASWIDQLPESAAREQSIKTYATQIAGNQPQAAIRWAERISDEEQREKTLTTIAGEWWRVDRAAASEWIAKSSLPQKVKEKYLKE